LKTTSSSSAHQKHSLATHFQNYIDCIPQANWSIIINALINMTKEYLYPYKEEIPQEGDSISLGSCCYLIFDLIFNKFFKKPKNNKKNLKIYF